MAFETNLRDFVVKLAVDSDFRDRYANMTEREKMMKDAQLSESAVSAIRESDGGTLRTLLNQQVSPAAARGVLAALDKRKGKKAKGGKKKGAKKR